MANLNMWNGTGWEDVLIAREDRLTTTMWIYEAYDPQDLHDSNTRTFTLRSLGVTGAPSFSGSRFVRLDIWARIGRGAGSNTITYRGASSEYVSTPPWSTQQFVLHAGFTTAPSSSGASLVVTTNYPMPTTDPSLYMFAIGYWN